MPPAVHWLNTTHDRKADSIRKPVVTAIEAVSPIRRPNRPATAAPSSGR